MFPTEVANQYYEAQRLFAMGKAAQALIILDGIEKYAPNHPEIMHARALCLHANGNLREALRVCNQLYTMHRDKRGLELRNRWTNPRWVAKTELKPEGPPAPQPEAARQDTSVEAETFTGPPTQIVAPVVEPPASIDAAFLRDSAVVIMGLGAAPRPAPLEDDAELSPRLMAAAGSTTEHNAAVAHRHDVCLPNAARIAAAARAAGLPLVLLQWGFQCPDGSDLSPHVYLRMREEFGEDASHWPGHAGAPERLPAPELASVTTDRLLHMTGDDAFTSTNLRFVLHNLAVKNLVLVGGPVETALTRTLATGKKRGFAVAVPADATYATRESHRALSIADAAPEHTTETAHLLELLEELAREKEAASGHAEAAQPPA